MAIERVLVIDHKILGDQLIALAKGEAVIPDKSNMALENITIGDLKKYFGNNVRFPAHITSVSIIQGKDRSELIIKLPPREMIEDSLNSADTGGDYPLPPFYQDIIFGTGPVDNLNKRDVLAMRVGDYSMGQCT